MFGLLGGCSVCRYDGKSIIRHALGEKDYYSCNAILEDKQRNLWFGGCGITRYDGNTYAHYPLTDSGCCAVNCMLQDSTGDIWVGTHKGLYKYNGSKYITYSAPDELDDNNVNYILKDNKGNIWFADEKGVSCYNGSSFKKYTFTYPQQ